LELGNGTRFSNSYLYTSKTESKSLISIENVMVTERGKGKKEVEEIVAPNYVDVNYILQLKAKFKIRKSSFFDFFTELYS
jgi:diaminopimelate epimerase